MNPLLIFKPLRICLAILGISLLLSASLFAAQYKEEISTDEYIFVKGMVHTVSLEGRFIKVQQKKGPLLTIFLNSETEFKGFKKLEELQSRQDVKIWYRPVSSGNIGLKILRPPELGC